MGLFNWLFRPAGPARATTFHHIWMNEPATLRGLLLDLHERVADSQPVLLTAHFVDELGTLVDAMQAAGIAFQVWTPPAGHEQARRELAEIGGGVRIVQAADLPVWESSSSSTSGTERHPCLLAVFQHHPLAAEDQRICEFAASQGIASVEFYASLDHPLFVRMVGNQFTELLRSLGMQENEAIESAMVSRQIEPLQRRVARRVNDPLPADNCSEWFDRNFT